MNMSLVEARRTLPIDGRDWLFIATPPQPRQPLDTIFAVVAEAFGIDPFVLETTRKRAIELVWPRQIALYLAVELSPLGTFKIAKFARLDPKTVRYAHKLVTERRKADPRVNQLVGSLIEKVRRR